MVEDYRINQRIGHCEQTGVYEITRMKTRKAVSKFTERFRTNKGDFLPEEWRKQIMEEVSQLPRPTTSVLEVGACNCPVVRL